MLFMAIAVSMINYCPCGSHRATIKGMNPHVTTEEEAAQLNDFYCCFGNI